MLRIKSVPETSFPLQSRLSFFLSFFRLGEGPLTEDKREIVGD